jgi:HAD superfamily hydrolase (TIGR01509 family)
VLCFLACVPVVGYSLYLMITPSDPSATISALMLNWAKPTDGDKYMLGALRVPDPARGLLFDLDGVLTRKKDLVLELIRTGGVTVYPGSVRYVHAVRDAGLPCAVATSGANAEQVLSSAGLSELFDARVDGLVATREGLAGKPAADTFLAGARLLGVSPEAAVMFEDALAGVAAGRDGHFGYVVGVDQIGHVDALRAHGADLVVCDLAELMDRS